MCACIDYVWSVTFTSTITPSTEIHKNSRTKKIISFDTVLFFVYGPIDLYLRSINGYIVGLNALVNDRDNYIASSTCTIYELCIQRIINNGRIILYIYIYIRNTYK